MSLMVAFLLRDMLAQGEADENAASLGAEPPMVAERHG
jgi:hypothetical protein